MPFRRRGARNVAALCLVTAAFLPAVSGVFSHGAFLVNLWSLYIPRTVSRANSSAISGIDFSSSDFALRRAIVSRPRFRLQICSHHFSSCHRSDGFFNESGFFRCQAIFRVELSVDFRNRARPVDKTPMTIFMPSPLTFYEPPVCRLFHNTLLHFSNRYEPLPISRVGRTNDEMIEQLNAD